MTPYDEVPERQKNGVARSGPARGRTEDPVERYQRHFVQLLKRNTVLGQRPIAALELACGSGASTIELLSLLPKGSRLVALDNERPALKTLHSRLDKTLRRSIYARKEKLHHLPFATNIFDVVWAALPTKQLSPLRPVLRQALRVLRPGGQLLLSVPLRTAFVELAEIIAQKSGAAPDEERLNPLLAPPPDLLTEEDWVKTLHRCGAVEIDVRSEQLHLQVQPPLSTRPIVADHLLPLWVGTDPSTREMAAQRLDELFTEPLELVLNVACIVAHSGMSESDTGSLSAADLEN